MNKRKPMPKVGSHAAFFLGKVYSIRQGGMPISLAESGSGKLVWFFPHVISYRWDLPESHDGDWKA